MAAFTVVSTQSCTSCITEFLQQQDREEEEMQREEQLELERIAEQDAMLKSEMEERFQELFPSLQ